MAVQLTPSHARWSFAAGTAGLQQYQFCSLNSSGQLVAPSSGVTVTGVFAVILDDAPSLAVSTVGTGNVLTGGYSVGSFYGVVLPTGSVMKVITGATLSTPGTPVTTDANGHAVAVTNLSQPVLGYTIQASTSGDIAPIVFKI